MNIKQIFGSIITTIFVLLLLVFAISLNQAKEIVSDTFSDYNIKNAYLYNIMSAPCITDVLSSRPESKKYIFDRYKLDREQEEVPSISCIDTGSTKYRINIIDTDSGKKWQFSNYQPLEWNYGNYRTPELEQVIQINSYTTPPQSEFEVRDLDRFSKGLISAAFVIDTTSGNLSDEMYCEKDPSTRIYIIPGGTTNDAAIRSSYYYPANNCESGNCIKGPGQSYATCQPAENTYDIGSGMDCATGYQCRSAQCESGKCTGPRQGLLIGQPCISNDFLLPDKSCITGYCRDGLVCACDKDEHCAPQACELKKGICI